MAMYGSGCQMLADDADPIHATHSPLLCKYRFPKDEWCLIPAHSPSIMKHDINLILTHRIDMTEPILCFPLMIHRNTSQDTTSMMNRVYSRSLNRFNYHNARNRKTWESPVD
ncbi:hypothetical protein MVEN_01872600 [Mycena venus]|uniref:Uncharacterized protein n=1 Tax=Mycena venus TaxID=2733690 RepID=A0A8H6XIX9_9AGAR|nr:hypothetical protein MVEN_01872600 [Mycena venus]